MVHKWLAGCQVFLTCRLLEFFFIKDDVTWPLVSLAFKQLQRYFRDLSCSWFTWDLNRMRQTEKKSETMGYNWTGLQKGIWNTQLLHGRASFSGPVQKGSKIIYNAPRSPWLLPGMYQVSTLSFVFAFHKGTPL